MTIAIQPKLRAYSKVRLTKALLREASKLGADLAQHGLLALLLAESYPLRNSPGRWCAIQSHARLASRAGCSAQTIARQVKALEEFKLITRRVGKQRTTTRFFLCSPDLSPVMGQTHHRRSLGPITGDDPFRAAQQEISSVGLSNTEQSHLRSIEKMRRDLKEQRP